MKYEKIFRYIGFAAIGLLLIGLAGWYFFISRQTADITTADAGRGFNIGVPSFTGSRGSTAENIAAGFGGASSADAAPEAGTPPPRLWRVSATPIAGAGFIGTGSTSALRFVERSTGYVFDADPATGAVARRTNELIPKVYEAMIGPDDTVAERTLMDGGGVDTFIGKLTATTSDSFLRLEGVDFGTGIADVALTGPSVLFLTHAAGKTQLIESELDGSNPVERLSLGAGDFDIVRAGSRTFLIERPASGITGHAYELAGGTLASLSRPGPGLTALPRATSSALLIGTDDGARLSLAVRAAANTSAVSLGLPTTADKCVWSPQAVQAFCAVPDAPPAGFLTRWYQGLVHTTDTWYVVDAGAGSADRFLAMNPDDAIDVENPVMDDTGAYIAFTNARDKSLWMLRIAE